MLTPRINDDNRKTELSRRKKEPDTFGSVHSTQRRPKDWSPTGLVTADGKHLGTDPRK